MGRHRGAALCQHRRRHLPGRGGHQRRPLLLHPGAGPRHANDLPALRRRLRERLHAVAGRRPPGGFHPRQRQAQRHPQLGSPGQKVAGRSSRGRDHGLRAGGRGPGAAGAGRRRMGPRDDRCRRGRPAGGPVHREVPQLCRGGHPQVPSSGAGASERPRPSLEARSGTSPS